MRRPFVFLSVILGGLVVDQISKILVFNRLGEGESTPLIADVLHFTHGKNTGVAFSLLKQHPGLILWFTCVVAAGLVIWWWRTRRDAPLPRLWALALILIGAIGNLVDRIVFGYVRDFIDFRPELPVIGHWAVFNVADMCICVGVGLYLLSEWLAKPRGPEETPVPPPLDRQTQTPR